MEAVYGQYRLRSGVTIYRDLVYRSDPLAVTRINRSAKSLLDGLSEDQFQSVEELAGATDVQIADADSLLRQMFERGFLAWNPEEDTDYQPAVSIIVTVRNEEQTISELLRRLRKLDYPAYEIVLVDDGSTDDTREIIQSSSLATTGKLRLVTVGSDSDPLGIGASRNVGVEKAENTVIAFTDADCRPERDWLAKLVPALAYHDVVGGRVRPIENGTVIHEYESHHTSLDMGPHASPVKRDSSTPYLPTANLIGHKDVFENHPFPARNVAEDVALSWEALGAGFDLVYSPAGQVAHDFGDFANFLRRRLSYGTSEALLADAYGHPGSVPLPVISALSAILLLAWAAIGQLGAVDFPVAGVLLTGFVLGVVADPAKQSITALRETPIQPARVGWGFLRSSVSRIYGLAKEITRYYSIPIFSIGIVAAFLGYTQFGLSLIGLSVGAMGFSLLTDLLVQHPENFLTYSLLYCSDHLAYQLGAYRGAGLERSIAHLYPPNRFVLTR